MKLWMPYIVPFIRSNNLRYEYHFSMTYLITGASGFIGSHLINLIREEDKDSRIVALDIVKNAHEGKAEYVYCDVRNEITLDYEPCADDVIFNLAAVHRTPGHPDYEYFETNIRGAENVCDFARKHGIKRIVFTSSIAPYGAAEDAKEETTLPTPNTPYGISKLVAEKIHEMWAAEDKERQLTIVRPGVVFGLGENGNFTRLYNGLKSRKFAYPGRKDTIKACIYVKDLVGFMMYKLENHGCGVERYNCTFEPAFTIEQIVETMKCVSGMKRFVPLIPSWVLMPAAAVIGFFGAPMGICPARVRKLMISTNIIGKKMQASGYKFKYTLSEAIQDWIKDSGGNGVK